MKSLKDRIFVANDFSQLSDLTKDFAQVFCVYDRNLCQYEKEVIAITKNIKGSYAVCATEENKIISTVLDICDWLLDNDANRNDLLITIGGGITSDMGGFAASIYKRGISFAYIPTTLLSQVDAAIGGKTGVNFKSYKNILGTIVQPQFTYINVSVLNTLPNDQFLSGAAEMLKTFIIDDAVSYHDAVALLSANNRDNSKLFELISKAAMIKAGVVERDEFEKNERRKLNLGHTFAHAIEWYQQENHIPNGYSHGEAVAIGIYQAALLSELLGICAKGTASMIKEDFTKCGLPIELPYNIDLLDKAFFKDKKAETGGVHFVLVREIGGVETVLISGEQWAFAKRAIYRAS